jgi:tRNA threonylcarbamoyladenosine biosynthesis protein TsaE
MSNFEFVALSLDDTMRLGQAIGSAAEAGDLVYLNGDLGTGKTTLTKGIAAAIGISEHEVTSPTFSLINEHTHGKIPLYHLDIYRLSRPGELIALGFDDYVSAADGIIVVEWATNAKDELPDDALTVTLLRAKGRENQRFISVTSSGPASDRLLTKITKVLQ